MGFYLIEDYTVFQRGVIPYISTILEGYPDLGPCPECYEVMGHLTGDLLVEMAVDPAVVWPDLLECEEYRCFIVSQHFVDAMRVNNIRIEPGGRVEFEGPIENGLSLDDSPNTTGWMERNAIRRARWILTQADMLTCVSVRHAGTGPTIGSCREDYAKAIRRHLSCLIMTQAPATICLRRICRRLCSSALTACLRRSKSASLRTFSFFQSKIQQERT